MYYRLYTKDGPITSNNPIYANNPFISRTFPKFVAPPRTALSVKNHLCKIEGLSAPTSSALFESLSSETAVVESSRFGFRGYSGPELSENDPIVLVVGVEDTEKRLASTAQLERLPDAVLPEPRYVYYRLYDEDGALASKMSFDPEDSSLGRIDTHSIAPPQTVSSLSFQVMKAEGFVTRTVHVYQDMDGEVLMTDNDHLPLQAQAYPGHDEDEPVTIVCSQENQGKAGTPHPENGALVGPVDSSLLMRIRGGTTWEPDKIYQPDWLPFKYGEIMYTDGIKTTGYIQGRPPSPYSGYIAMNSAGRKGFVHDGQWQVFMCNISFYIFSVIHSGHLSPRDVLYSNEDSW
ncbi:hypothetical protein K443DRAFT_542968 [Laccaria amethystina LaAM-08-1]|uniref:Uncharacterized protein n=1 Tax=Laccaria amethystina LaAM-08-1 TaxID=1095629 RepID=A0A0C9XWS1_9AGAR|nr:hypothetical protein K443DRAFT_542968 [Laccaria amethystina LaAM-08-1]